MATIAMDVPDRQVSIGRVFSRAFATIGGNPVTTIGIAFLFGALPRFLLGLIVRPLRASDPTKMNVGTGLIITLGSGVLGIAFYAIVQGSLVRATVDHEDGSKASLGESMMSGLRVALPLIGMAILSAIGLMVGMVLFIVPGIILYVMWCVAAPALVDERLGVFSAFGRSRALTKGYRWRILGLLLVLILTTYLVMGLIAVVFVTGRSFSLTAFAAAQQNQSAALMIGMLLVQTLFAAVYGVCLASLFVELRNAKDGPSKRALADVFR